MLTMFGPLDWLELTFTRAIIKGRNVVLERSFHLSQLGSLALSKLQKTIASPGLVLRSVLLTICVQFNLALSVGFWIPLGEVT